MVEANRPDPDPTEGESDPDLWVAEESTDPEPGSEPADELDSEPADEPEEEETYRLAEEVTPSGKSASHAADWYYMAGEGPQRGPVTLGDLQRLVAAGELARSDRVWRSGLAEWTAVADVPEMFDEAGPPPPPRPRPLAAAPDRDDDRTPDPVEGLRSMERSLTEPAVLKGVGWACGAIGAMAGVISVPMLFFNRSWFAGSAVLLVAFFVLHALARVIEDSRR